MHKLIDTFNSRTISRHRTLDAAVKASAKHSRGIRKRHGASSYIPKQIVEEIDGKDYPVADHEIYAAERRVLS